jgi:hypothetical protein
MRAKIHKLGVDASTVSLVWELISPGPASRDMTWPLWHEVVILWHECRLRIHGWCSRVPFADICHAPGNFSGLGVLVRLSLSKRNNTSFLMLDGATQPFLLPVELF